MVSSLVSAAEGLTYVDPVAAQEFEEATGVVTEITQVVNGPVEEVWDDWLQKLWIAKNSILSPGVGRGLVGNRKFMESVDAEETITAAALPTGDNTHIPTINFVITSFGKFPWVYHTGFVQFIPTDGGKKTTLKWSNKTRSKSNDDGTPFDDSDMRALVKASVEDQLAAWVATYPAEH